LVERVDKNFCGRIAGTEEENSAQEVTSFNGAFERGRSFSVESMKAPSIQIQRPPLGRKQPFRHTAGKKALGKMR
jgi:hypothetical protein